MINFMRLHNELIDQIIQQEIFEFQSEPIDIDHLYTRLVVGFKLNFEITESYVKQRVKDLRVELGIMESSYSEAIKLKIKRNTWDLNYGVKIKPRAQDFNQEYQVGDDRNVNSNVASTSGLVKYLSSDEDSVKMNIDQKVSEKMDVDSDCILLSSDSENDM